MSQHFGDLEGVETDIDDIIVHAETEVKHDHRLQAVLERCEKINLTLNKEKCVFKVKEVTYIGHKLTQEGIKPDDERVRAINDMMPEHGTDGKRQDQCHCKNQTEDLITSKIAVHEC